MKYSGLRCCIIGLVLASMSGWATAASSSAKAGLECGFGTAGISFLACKLSGKSSKECAEIGAGVGLAGALACSLYAKHLEARRKELAGKENDLDAQIHYVQGLNADTQKLNADLTQRVTSVTQDTDKLVAKIAQQQITQEQLAKERKNMDDLVKTSQSEVTQGTQALEEAKQFRAQKSGSSAKLDSAIAQQEQLLAEAQRQVDQLAAQRARV
ncbi:MAG TPA: hypothetical protein VMT66_03990 [Steroidobacteraceae bacterium]|nr:hypothetical protein [Steroidobacteraceae bacterium]